MISSLEIEKQKTANELKESQNEIKKLKKKNSEIIGSSEKIEEKKQNQPVKSKGLAPSEDKNLLGLIAKEEDLSD